MATQHESRLPFTLATEQQSFKLLELPPSLLDVLTSPNPSSLTIKSQDPSLPSSTATPTASHVVLCTNDQTFQLRQVQTSNSVYITRAAQFRRAPDAFPESSIAAIADCNHTLELHSVKDSPLPQLKFMLPEYRESEDVKLPNNKARSKRFVFSNVPFSDQQCEKAWLDLCAFEVDGRSWRPSATAMNAAWQTIMITALAEGLHIDSTFSRRNLENVLKEEETPMPLFNALLSSTCIRNGDDLYSLDKAKVIKWLGDVVLKAHAEKNAAAVPVTTFLTLWRETLPESWRSDAQVELVKDSSIHPTPTTISPKDDTADASVIQAKDSSGPAKTGAGARKWHERFKASRR